MGDRSVIFEFIDEQRTTEDTLTVKEMCELAGVSRSGYYEWRNAATMREKREEQDHADFEKILKIYNRHGYAKGVRSIYIGLQRENPPVLMNMKKIRRLMHKYHLVCPIRKPNPYKKIAKAVEESSVAPNILEREFDKYGPRTILLTDITYLHYGDGKTAYLSTILDAYTKEILAWVCSESMEVTFVIKTLQQLDEKHGEELQDAVLIHSDQGVHYKSHAFQNALADRKLIQSMSRKGNCWDNQPMEYFFGGLKDHVRRLIAGCGAFPEVISEIDRYMKYYNNSRYQWKLAKLAPAEFYRFCVTGQYPLQIGNVPPVPVPEKTTEDLSKKAERMLEIHRKGAGTKASDSTLDEPPDPAVESGQRLPE